MKKAHNLNQTNKLKLNKLKIAKLDDITSVKGGQSYGGGGSLTWTTIGENQIIEPEH